MDADVRTRTELETASCRCSRTSRRRRQVRRDVGPFAPACLCFLQPRRQGSCRQTEDSARSARAADTYRPRGHWCRRIDPTLHRAVGAESDLTVSVVSRREPLSAWGCLRNAQDAVRQNRPGERWSSSPRLDDDFLDDRCQSRSATRTIDARLKEIETLDAAIRGEKPTPTI